ncbi:MAG: hypothetical protein ABIP01_06390 [Candidatus Limnocylindria bacterium]
MSRGNRIALIAAAALLVAVTGTVVATRAPDGEDEPAQQTQDGEDAPPTAEDIAHAVERLQASDLDVEPSLLTELTAEYGLGGAVRIVAWSADNAKEADMAAIRAMRDGDGTEGSGMGWGRIAKELGVHPGIGSIMGNGGGHGRGDAPGQQKDRGGDEGDASGG